LLVETDIETGLRWGELTELQLGDLDIITRVLTISRTVVQVDPKFHPTGGRFGGSVPPVVADDLVPFGEEVSELRVRQQGFGHGPGGCHRGCQPGAALLAAGGHGLQLGLDAGDLCGLTLAFHEQHAAGFDRALIVEVGCPGERTGSGHGGLGGCPSFGQGESVPFVEDPRGMAGVGIVGSLLAIMAFGRKGFGTGSFEGSW